MYDKATCKTLYIDIDRVGLLHYLNVKSPTQ